MQLTQLTTRTRSEYLGSIAMNILFYVLVNFIVEWSDIPFATKGITTVLSFLNIALVAAILGNALLFVYDGSIFRTLVKAFLNVLGVVFIISFLRIFPLNLGSTSISWFAQFIRFAAVMVAVAMVAGAGAEVYTTYQARKAKH